MEEITREQKLKLITDNVESVRHRFFRDLKEDYSPDTKSFFRQGVLGELQGIQSTVLFAFGSYCTAYEAAAAAWNEIHAINLYS